MHWTEVPIHFLDFEGSLASGVVEYGIATLQGGEIASTRTRLCSPSGPLRAEDVAVHGLDLDDTAGAPPLREHWDFFAALRQRGPLAAHFAGTENALLKAVWPFGRVSPDFARPGQTTADWGPWIDTGRLVPQLFRDTNSAKLEDLIFAFGLSETLSACAETCCPANRRRFHAALYDALAGALLLRAVLQRAEFSAATIPWLLQQSILDGARRAALQQGELF